MESDSLAPVIDYDSVTDGGEADEDLYWVGDRDNRGVNRRGAREGDTTNRVDRRPQPGGQDLLTAARNVDTHSSEQTSHRTDHRQPPRNSPTLHYRFNLGQTGRAMQPCATTADNLDISPRAVPMSPWNTSKHPRKLPSSSTWQATLWNKDPSRPKWLSKC